MRQGTPITREHVRVGIVLILALGMLTFGIFRIGGTGHVFGERYRLVTTLRTAAGLSPGAVVQLAGQSVGHQFAPDFGGYLLVLDGAVTVNGDALANGDATMIWDEDRITIEAGVTSELVMMEVQVKALTE